MTEDLQKERKSKGTLSFISNYWISDLGYSLEATVKLSRVTNSSVSAKVEEEYAFRFDVINGSVIEDSFYIFPYVHHSTDVSICSMEVIGITCFAKQLFTRLYHALKITVLLYSVLNSNT